MKGLGALLPSVGETMVGSDAAMRSFVGGDLTHPPFLPFSSSPGFLFSDFPPFLQSSLSPAFLSFSKFPL